MEFAVATKKTATRGALTVPWQLVLLIAASYGVSYIVPACISFASRQVNEEPRSSAFVRDSSFRLTAELVCESTPSRLWERSACDLPK
jgi:hypothetical protein